MSGYTDNEILRRGINKSDTDFLQKPFTADSPVRGASCAEQALDRFRLTNALLKNTVRGLPGRILIVDDHAENITLLERILAKAGYRQVASTTNSDDALTLHKKFKSDLVLLDFHMTGKDGFEVLEEIVSNSEGHPVSVIMITGDDTADVKRRARPRRKRFPGQAFRRG
jgi:CheY-like chemotaxis protein